MIKKISVIFMIIGTIGIVIGVVESFNYTDIVMQKENVESKYTHLKTSYEDLNNSYNALEDSYNSLNQDYYILQQKYNNLKSEYDSINTSYSALQSSYNALEDSYNSLNQDYGELIDEYNQLMDEYNSLVAQWNDLVDDWNKLINFLGNRYGNDTRKFITPDDSTVVSAKNSIISSDGNLSWNDMKTINDWVHNNIAYNNDTFIDYKNGQFLESFWMYPNETLKYRFGDCEEYATLMVSLCKSEQNVNWLWCVLTNITSENKTEGHAIVFVNVEGDKLYIFDPTAGWNSSYAMNEQNALDEYCSVFGYNRIDIISVFNENEYYEFNSNQDFFNWF